MGQLKKVLFLLLVLPLVTSCSSYMKRKTCEKTNWFNYGKNVAESGRRLDEDNFIQECKRVESEIDFASLDIGFKKGRDQYCEPGFVNNLGKKGQKFSREMCSGPGQKKLVDLHMKGVRTYCKPANGYSEGAKGVTYNQVCPEDLESAFLSQYGKGRKKYLQITIQQKQSEMRTKDQEIGYLYRRKSDLAVSLARTPSRSIVKRERKWNAATSSYSVKTKVVKDQEVENTRSRLNSDIYRTERKIEKLNKNIESLKSEVNQMQIEMNSL